MKKFLLSTLFCLLAITGIQAEEVTFVAEGASYSGNNGVTMATGNIPGNTYASENIELSLTQKSSSVSNVNSNGHVRWYKYDILNVTPKNGVTITKIVFNTTGGEKYCVAPIANTGTATASTADNTITWEGATTSTLELAADNGQIRFTTMTVTYTTEGGSVTPDQGGEGEEGEGEGEDEGETEVTFTTIAEVLAAGAGEAATKGTVVATYARGFLMSDGTGSILVFQGTSPAVTTAVGDAVNVSGTTSVYGGLLQFAAGSTVEKTGTATVNHPTATVMDGAAMDAYLAAPEIKYVEYTGTLTVNGSYYNVAVEGAATAIGSIQYPQDAIKANLTNGAVVKVTGYTIGVSSSKYVNTMAVKVEVIEGGEEPEVPTEVKEYTVAEAIAAYVDGKQIPAIITGYIVGTIDGQAYTDGCRFSGTAESKTNLLIADNVDETDPAKCMPVQLPSGAVRNALNLVDNPGNYKKEVKLTGSLEKYFSVPGLKAVTEYEIEGATPEEPEVPTEAKEYTVNEALAAYVDGKQIPAIVTGYIVGAMNSSGYVPEFGATTISTNLLLSDDPEEDAIENCIIVQLPSGDIRTALNLVEHPDYFQKKTKITGSIETYFKQAGLKNPTAYEFTDGTGIEDVILGETAAKVIFDITGRRIDQITNPGIYIVNGKKVLVK